MAEPLNGGRYIYLVGFEMMYVEHGFHYRHAVSVFDVRRINRMFNALFFLFLGRLQDQEFAHLIQLVLMYIH